MKKRAVAKTKKKKTAKAVKSAKKTAARKSAKKTVTRKTAQARKPPPSTPSARSPAETLSVQQDIAGLLSMLVQKLSSFETKLDTVLTRVMSQPPQALPAQPGPAVPMSMPQRPRPQKQYYAAICAHCGKDCEIPFKPNGTRPVYCRECFAKRKSGAIIRPPVAPAPRPGPQPQEKIKAAAPARTVPPPAKTKKAGIKKKAAAAKKKATAKKKKKVSRKK